MARRLVRPVRSAFRVGDEVRWSGDYEGPYVGKVTEVHNDVSKVSGCRVGPGVTVRCHVEDGVDLKSMDVPFHQWPLMVFNDQELEPVSIPA